MITGTVRLDLTPVPVDRQRHRVAAAAMAPTGARVVLVVGALAVNWPALVLLREHLDRLDIDVQGEPHAVQEWVTGLRTGDLMAGAGWSP